MAYARGKGADEPGGAEYLRRNRADLLRIASNAWHPLGFGWLGDDGSLLSRKDVQLWITRRMTHVFALASLLGEAGADEG